MNITYTLERSAQTSAVPLNDLSGVITAIKWRVVGRCVVTPADPGAAPPVEEVSIEQAVSGQVDFDPPKDGASFTPRDGVTDDQMLEWIAGGADNVQPWIDARKADVAATIAAAVAPPPIIEDVPAISI